MNFSILLFLLSVVSFLALSSQAFEILAKDGAAGEIIAGTTTSINFILHFDEDDTTSGSSPFEAIVKFASPQGCAPGYALDSNCDSSPDNYTVSGLTIADSPFVEVSVDVGFVDFSLGGQTLSVFVNIPAHRLSTGYTNLAVVQAAQPTITASSAVLTAGQNGSSSFEISGSGFSLYPSQIRIIRLRAKNEDFNIFKPSLTVLSSTETTMEVAIQTSCRGVDITHLDTSLAGNQLVVTRLEIGTSNQVYTSDTGVEITGVIAVNEPSVQVVNLVDFSTQRVELRGNFFSCNMDMMSVEVETDGNRGVVPNVKLNTTSRESIVLEFSSCNNTLSGLDYSLSGSILKAKVGINTNLASVATTIAISDTLQAPVPEISGYSNAPSRAAEIFEGSWTIQGSGFSCEDSMNKITLSSAGNYGVVPEVSITSVARDSLQLSVSTCNGSLVGVDSSLIGTQLEAVVSIDSTAGQQSVQSTVTDTISGDSPTVNAAQVSLLTGNSSALLSLPSTGFSCFASQMTVEVTNTEAKYVLPTIEVTNSSMDSVELAISSCNGTLGIDNTMAGKVLSINVKMQIGEQVLQTGAFDLGNEIEGVTPFIELDTDLVAGVKQVEMTGGGFSCDSTFNKVEFSLATSRLRKLQDTSTKTLPSIDLTESNPTFLTGIVVTNVAEKKYNGLDFSMVGSTLDMQFTLLTEPEIKSERVSTSSIIGNAPVLLSGTKKSCIEALTNKVSTLSAQNVPFSALSMKATLKSGDKQIEDGLEIIDVTSTDSGETLEIKVKESVANDISTDTELMVKIEVLSTGLTSEYAVLASVSSECSADNSGPNGNTSNGPGAGGAASNSSAGLSGAAIAGIIIGLIAAIGFVAEVVVLNKRREKQAEDGEYANDDDDMEFVDTPMGDEVPPPNFERTSTPKEEIACF